MYEDQKIIRLLIFWNEKMGEWSDYFEDFPEENPANQRYYGTVDSDELRAQQNYSPKFRAREHQVSEAAKARKLKTTTEK